MSIKKNQYILEIHFHPGETLAEKLEEMGMSSKEFAMCADESEKTISAVLNGGSAITSNLAIQFENVTQIPAHFWMNSQRNYNEFVAREKQKKNLRKFTPSSQKPIHTLQEYQA